METFETPVLVFIFRMKEAILVSISSFEGTFLPSKLSKASIELIFTLLALKLIVYFIVPEPSLFTVTSSIISMHEVKLNKMNAERKNLKYLIDS